MRWFKPRPGRTTLRSIQASPLGVGLEFLESRRLLAVDVLSRLAVNIGSPTADVLTPIANAGEAVSQSTVSARILKGAGLAPGEFQLAGHEVSQFSGRATESTTFVSATSPPNAATTSSLVVDPGGGTQFAIGTPDIIINAGATLAANQPALDAFNRAAELWEAAFSDPIIVTIDADLIDLGSTSIIGQASSVILQAGHDTIRNQLVLDADADDSIVAQLPTAAQFGATLPVGFGLTGNITGNKASLKAAGFAGLDGLFGASDATIQFNTQFAFDFDNSDGVMGGTIDFESVAAHEIGHALGFTSIVDSVDFQVNNGQTSNISPRTLDLFRFADNVAGQDPSTPTEFTNFNRNLTPGDAANTDDTVSAWAMSTGAFTGDGRQASHWKDNGLTGQLIGVMDPTLAFGQIVPITDADLRALDLIGWDIVFGANQPPVLDPIANQVVDEGSLLTFTATASDPDMGDQLIFSLAPGAPSGATIDPNTGVFQWTPDDSTAVPLTVTVIVTDNGSPSMSDQQAVQITVNNVAPTAAITGPATAVPGQTRSFTLSASDPSSVDQAGNFTFSIDWDGDTIIDETVVGPSGTQVGHVFTLVSMPNISVTATDKDGGIGPAAATTIDVTQFAVQADESNPTLTNLAFGGTSGLDAVFFLPNTNGNITLFTAVLGNQLISQIDVFAGIDGRLIAYGLGGADIIASDFVSLPVEFHGGNGDDVLSGGMGADLIDGEAGNDMLFGTTANGDSGDTLLGADGTDFFYANLGADSIDGGAGEDLMIAGTVSFSNGTPFDGLVAIRNEWLSSRAYATRVANISGTGSGPKLNGNFFLIPGQTVFSDGATDQLLGGADLDWFLYGFLEDTAQDPQAGEVQTDTGI